MPLDLDPRQGRDQDFRPDRCDGPDARNVRLVGHCPLDGRADAMQIGLKDGYAFIGHLGEYGVGTSVVDVRDPAHPRLVKQLPIPPYTHSHKVQIVGDTLLVNHEQYGRGGLGTPGLKVYDVSDPTNPRETGFLPMTGKGVHRLIYWSDPYAYVSGSEAGWIENFFMVVDVSDKSRPREVSRWWFPGQWQAGGEPPTAPKGRRWWCHHGIVRNGRAYCGWWDAGLIILDVTDVEKPRFVSRLDFGQDVSGGTHTALPLPGRDVLVVTDECIRIDHARNRMNQTWVVDIADEKNPRVITTLPVPDGNWCERCQTRHGYGHFGPHNLHEMRPGTFTDPNIVHATYFQGGLRVFDLTDAARPREIAHYIPEAPPGRKNAVIDDVIVDANGLIYCGDRFGGGLYILELTGRG